MHVSPNSEFFKQVEEGLKESIQFSKGEIDLKTTDIDNCSHSECIPSSRGSFVPPDDCSHSECVLSINDIVNENNNLKSEVENLKDKLLRSQAETANVVKRLNQQQEQAVKNAKFHVLFDILSIKDALESLKQFADTGSKDIRDGVTMTTGLIDKLFERYGVQEIDSTNQVFDPHWHEALSKTGESDTNLIVDQVFQKGYKVGDNVLRHAKVSVKTKES